MAVSVVTLDASPASALQVDPCVVIVDVSGAGEPIPCAPTATPDPCEVVSKGLDPCGSATSTPDPCVDVAVTGQGYDRSLTETPTPEPTLDPCAPTKDVLDPCATETVTPAPTRRP